jgi:hypothetical protein
MTGDATSPKIPIESKNLRSLEEFDLLSKLRHGYMVTDIEKVTLLALAAGLEDEANAIDAEDARLAVSRDQLRRAAEQARSLVASIRRLPPEILAEIFFFTDPTIYCHYGRHIANCGLPMILVGKVCSSWHRLVLNTPSLWTHIIVKTDQPSPAQVQRLEQLIAMSGNMLLYLTVSLSNWDHEIWSDISSLIRQHSHRLKHVTLRGLPTVLVEVLNPPSFPALSFPELSSLHLTNTLQDNLVDILFGARSLPMMKISPAPNLHAVYLENTCSIHQRLFIDLPWEQLEELTLRGIYLSEIFFALPKCTSIKTATLISVGWLPDWDISHTIGQNPSLDIFSSTTLTKLTFVFQQDDEYAAIGECFNRLTLPTLKTLHIDAGRDWLGNTNDPWPAQVLEWPADSFKAFVNRSGFALTTLYMLLFPIKDLTVISILECLPQLEELVIKEADGIKYFKRPVSDEELDEEDDHSSWTKCLTNRLIERLHVGPPSSSGAQPESSSMAPNTMLVPYLKRLKLEGKGAPKIFSVARFLEMVNSRHRAPDGSVLNLKRVQLQISDQLIGKAVQEEIARLSLASDEFVLEVVGGIVQRMD